MANIDPVILQLRADLDKYTRDVQSTTSVVETSLGRQQQAAERASATIVDAMNRRAQQEMATAKRAQQAAETQAQASVAAAEKERAAREAVEIAKRDLVERYTREREQAQARVVDAADANAAREAKAAEKAAIAAEKAAQRKIDAAEKAAERAGVAAEKAAQKEIDASERAARAQEQAQRRATASRTAQTLLNIQQSTGLMPTGAGSAADSASVFADYDRQAQSLLGTLKPVYAEQLRLNGLMSQADDLFRVGALSAEQYASATDDINKRLKSLGDNGRHAANGAGEISTALRRLAGPLAAAFSARQVIAMGDAWSDMQSQVGVAIRDMEAAPDMMNRIADAARSSYSSLEQTAQAFSRNNRALSEMGYSSDQALRFTEALNNALVATATRGDRARQVQDAISKAMATGRLEAEGLESILTHGGAVAEVLARNLGVTVNQLYALRQEGKITGQVIAQSLVGSFEELKAQAEQMPATVSDAFQLIRNEITRYVGTADASIGATEKLATALIALSENIDVIIPALAVIGTALGIGWVTRMGAAAVAVRGVGGALTAAFGGPIGLAITGITMAITSFALETRKANDIIDSTADKMRDAEKVLQSAKIRSGEAGDAVRGMGDDAARAVPKINAFAGEVGAAAQKLFELARAQQSADLSSLMSRRVDIDRRIAQVESQSNAALRRRLDPRTPGRPTGFAGLADAAGAAGTRLGRVTGLWGRSEEDVQESLNNLRRESTAIDEALKRNASLTSFVADAKAELARETEKAGDADVKATSKGAAGAAARAQAVEDASKSAEKAYEREMAKLVEMEDLRQRLAAEAAGDWGIPPREARSQRVNPVDRAYDDARRVAEEGMRAFDDMLREQEWQQEMMIRNLSGLYYDLFSGATDNIWDNFKRMALMRLAEVAAENTFRNIAGMFGDSGVGGFLGSIFGRQGGGYMPPNSVRRVNEGRGGVELLRVGPKGGTVIPLGQAAAASGRGGTTVVQNITVDARNSVNPAGFEQRILGQANQFAVQAAGAASQATLQAMPQRMATFQRDGT